MCDLKLMLLFFFPLDLMDETFKTERSRSCSLCRQGAGV